MIPFLLKLLGVKVDAAQQVTAVSLQLRQSHWLGWLVFIALLLCVFTWWAYRFLGGHKDLSRGRRILLTALRIIMFLLLLFALLRPVFSFTVENRVRRALIALIDKSSSQNIEDIRRQDADIKRAAIGKGMIERLDQSVSEAQRAEVEHISRTALVKAVFENKNMDLIGQLKKRYDIEYLTFNRDVTVADEEALKSPPPADDSAESTAIGDAIRDVINRKRGQPVAGIMMVTDGANNAGSEPLDAANAAHQDHMPLYIYGVGITSPRDLVVESVFTPEVAFIKDEVLVTVRVKAEGLVGEHARLSLKLDGQEVAFKDLQFTEDGEMAVPLTFTPDKAGEFDLTASIPPRDDQTVKDNNSASQRLRVIDSKIKVLYVELAPRWEFRFIQSALMRDRRVDAKFILIQGDPDLAKAPDSPYLEKFPVNKDDLFKYDLIILGDVDPKFFTPEQLDFVNEFVAKFGGAMIFIAGQQFDPSAYVGTIFEKLLPVEQDTGSVAQHGNGDWSTTLALTTAGRSSPMLRLAPEEQENSEIWRSFAPIHWINRVSRAKPGAQVLLEDTDPVKATRYGRMPAMALQQYGVGQVLYMGTDDTWRWRQELGVAYYPLLWGQIIQRMALAHLLGGSKRTQLSVDKQHYTTAERVAVFARLYDQNFDPVKQTSVNGAYTIRSAKDQPEGPPQSVQLRAVPGQPGMYRGDFVPVSPGICTFHVESDPKTTIDMLVTKPRFEMGETAMNEPTLKEMARISGGAFFREEDLVKLPSSLSEKDETITRVVDADIWSSPIYFTLIFLVAVVEWIIRKRSQLK